MSEANQVAVDCMKMVAKYQDGEALNVQLLQYWREIAINALQPYITIMNEKFGIEGMWEFYAAEALAAAAAKLMKRHEDLDTSDIARVASHIVYPFCTAKDVRWICKDLAERQTNGSNYNHCVAA